MSLQEDLTFQMLILLFSLNHQRMLRLTSTDQEELLEQVKKENVSPFILKRTIISFSKLNTKLEFSLRKLELLNQKKLLELLPMEFLKHLIQLMKMFLNTLKMLLKFLLNPKEQNLLYSLLLLIFQETKKALKRDPY